MQEISKVVYGPKIWSYLSKGYKEYSEARLWLIIWIEQQKINCEYFKEHEVAKPVGEGNKEFIITMFIVHLCFSACNGQPFKVYEA